jgi:hypothetical protein
MNSTIQLENPPHVAWHYTTGENFIKIADSGVLLPTDAYIAPGEFPILWFSLNQIWEPTSRKAIFNEERKLVSFTKAQTERLGRGLARFGFPSALLTPWNSLWKLANISRKKAKALEIVGCREGAIPAHWMGCLHEIAVNDLRIEILDENKWVCVQEPSAADSFPWREAMKEAA